MNILSLNAGSSSLKFALHTVRSAEDVQQVHQGSIDKPSHVQLVDAIAQAAEAAAQRAPIQAIGCRVVHGGNRFRNPVVTDDAVLAAIQELAPLDPLHTAQAIETIQGARTAVPNTPVVAVFDTEFHQTLPAVASTYAIPKDLAEQNHIQRYGFHGISYRYVSNKLNAIDPIGKLVVCHLGNGASVCAIKDGVSIDTSMGFTPLEGLVMGTRSGDLDPGIILFLIRERGMSASKVDQLLNHQSGLAGLSGIGGDLRTLEQAAQTGNQQAELALEIFAYRVAKYIGSFAVALEGLDALCFTGGIGEHSSEMRTRICRRLKFLGIQLSPTANTAQNSARIDAQGSIPVWVVKTDEERQIALETFALLT